MTNFMVLYALLAISLVCSVWSASIPEDKQAYNAIRILSWASGGWGLIHGFYVISVHYVRVV